MWLSINLLTLYHSIDLLGYDTFRRMLILGYYLARMYRYPSFFLQTKLNNPSFDLEVNFTREVATLHG